MKPFFSIIVPLYNGEKYIEKSLKSCISQTFENIEVIIIDDYSQDNSSVVVRKYTQNDNRIKFFCNPQNLGTFRTRLEGIRYAQGEYILYVDADDFIHAQTCEILYQIIQNDFNQTQQYADIIGFGSEYFPSKIVPIPHIPFKSIVGNILKELFIKPKNPSILVWNKAYKTTILQSLVFKLSPILPKIPSIKMGDDILLVFMIYCLANKSIGINKNLYFYCDSLISITRKQDKRTKNIRVQNLKILLETTHILQSCDFLNTQKDFQQAKNKLINIIHSSIELEQRYDFQSFAYLKSCINSLKYYQKSQTYIRILLYLVSFGKIKL